MTAGQDRLCIAVMAVDGVQAGLIHRSLLERVAEIGGRLGCRAATSLGGLPVSFTGALLRRLRRDLAEVAAFADAARRTGWVLGDIAVAPGDRPVPVLDTPEGRLWASSIRGFELHGPDGARTVTEMVGLPGTARRTALPVLTAPLAEAAARAEVLEVFESTIRKAAPPLPCPGTLPHPGTRRPRARRISPP